MEKKYTPGPWVLDAKLPLKVYSDDAVGSIIADCSGKYAPLIGKSEREANMYLVASAPDMLEALEELLKPMDGILSVPGNEVKITYSIDTINKAKAAISKAYGQTKDIIQS